MGAVLIGLILVAFAGCSKVTQENYDKISTGMTLDEVQKILGKGTEKSGVGGAIGDLSASAKTITWGSEEKNITITFANDKVVTKTQKGL
ncbi:MAG: DUF3862 domain-containing protein [Planctomycetota bacterium]|nr:MAG: DUF3862 domain-containing protein [Planctomycetota bacterium]